MEYCLEVNNLTKRYKSFTLDNISLKLKQGSIMGFIGENGSGKTTTLKSILKLIRTDSGMVNIFGLDMSEEKNARNIKEQIGVVFDECHFHETLNAKAINTFMSRIQPNWNEKLYFHYLDTFDLPLNKTVKEYSRGMSMKLSIAAALSHQPKLLLLDEATSGLDPVVRNEILDVFFEYIQDEEHSILMSSHITSDLEKICDYISFIHNGKLIFSDDKNRVIENHSIVKCTKADYEVLDKTNIVGTRKNAFGYEVLVNSSKSAHKHIYDKFTRDNATLEDIMLFYSRGDKL